MAGTRVSSITAATGTRPRPTSRAAGRRPRTRPTSAGTRPRAPSRTPGTASTRGSGRGKHTVGATNDYWRNNFSTRPYATGRNYADYEPAYKYGQEAYNRYPGRRYEDVENDLSSGWERAKGASKLTWQEVKDAVKDAWHHVAGEPAGTTRY